MKARPVEARKGGIMKVIAIKDMSVGNESVGEMWQETKIFDGEDKLADVMEWAETTKKRITLTVPDGEKIR